MTLPRLLPMRRPDAVFYVCGPTRLVNAVFAGNGGQSVESTANAFAFERFAADLAGKTGPLPSARTQRANPSGGTAGIDS